MIRSKSVGERQFAERAAINAPIQGAAADIIRRAMIRMPAALQAAGLQARMLLQVHDELVFEAPEAEADASVRPGPPGHGARRRAGRGAQRAAARGGPRGRQLGRGALSILGVSGTGSTPSI